jgi:ribosome recycling factor
MTEIETTTAERMQKSIQSLISTLNKIRTGRAHPNLLDSIKVPYYGSDAPLSQVANVNVEDARTLSLRVWEKQLIPVVEKAIITSGLGLNPATAGEVIRIPLPPLTEDTRKGFIKQAKADAENARISIRNIRRDIITEIKNSEKDKQISEDESRHQQESIQKLTTKYIAEVDQTLQKKEQDLINI